MTKEEKLALENNTKELKNLNMRMDRIIRQQEIANVLKAKELGVDMNDIIVKNDQFERDLKRHAIEVIMNKKKGDKVDDAN